MLCDICAKNPATVHLTEIVDDQMSELHLCEECARKKSSQMESQFGLSDFLAGLADFDKPADEKENAALKCLNCGLTYKDFKKVGRFGCGDCYITFKKFLAPLLKRIHGSMVHCGKCPVKLAPGKSVRKKVDVQELRCRLQKAVETEAYEEAAKIRDQIKELLDKEDQTDKR